MPTPMPIAARATPLTHSAAGESTPIATASVASPPADSSGPISINRLAAAPERPENSTAATDQPPAISAVM